MHGVDILSGPPQGKANDVSSSPIQGRANDAGRAKDLLTINERNSTPEAGHIYLRTKKKRDLLGASGHPVRMPFAVTGKDGHTFQSRSSGREEEDNHEWRQAIEKRQLASEKQLKALLQETERLREENAVLRIQASTSGPPRRQRSKGQVANSKPEPESIYPGSTGAIPGTYNARPHEPRTPMPRAPREESSDSTHFSVKRQRDRKSQLSSSMRARLGPQEPGRSRPPAATTRAPRPDPMIAPMVQNVPPHRDPMVTLAMRNVHSHLAERPAGRNLPNEPPIGSISKRLDDMLSTPFCSHITHYEPQEDSSYQSFPHTMGPTIPSITSCTIDSL
ncbi:hypothetical protein CK203_043221 [Vitis vinifera]|uniref:Uncharacterized protein n=1 Tax=Vitis vinifera TaxID=29760 RepID=A0A438HPB7_VITVI|nr:hypothetical protein CK203_043221 [Vitis vinifera]